MKKGEQIDKVSKAILKNPERVIKHAKKEHKRAMRRYNKNPDNPNFQDNRYRGFIG